MNLIRTRIKDLLEEIKEEKEILNSESNFCAIQLLFETDYFFSRCSSVGDFMKKLKNGKITLNSNEKNKFDNLTNREYFKKIIGNGGFYRYNLGIHFVEINILFELKNEIDKKNDKEVITSRIMKIAKPIKFQIGFNDKELFREIFKDLTSLKSSWNVFGERYKIN